MRNSVRASSRGEAAEVGAGAADQRPPAAPPRLRVHGDAGDRERLEVAPGGLDRDLEFGGDLGRGHLPPRLEEQKGRHQTIGPHIQSFSQNVDTR